jgi:ubiquitin fusion degradation protein 1
VMDAKPTDKICLIDTDCEVDFAPPLDYEEPPPDFGNGASTSASATASSAIPSLFGRPPAKEKEAPPPEPEAPKFAAFGGSARRLVRARTARSAPPPSTPSRCCD